MTTLRNGFHRREIHFQVWQTGQSLVGEVVDQSRHPSLVTLVDIHAQIDLNRKVVDPGFDVLDDFFIAAFARQVLPSRVMVRTRAIECDLYRTRPPLYKASAIARFNRDPFEIIPAEKLMPRA